MSEEGRESGSEEERRLLLLGRMAAGLSHDLGNLFTVLLGYADLLRRLIPREGNAGEYLEQASRVIDRGSLLCRNLRFFSASPQAAAEAVHLPVFLPEAEVLMRRLLGPELGLSLEIAPGIPPVRCDRLHLQQVLFNLVSNARDALAGRGRVQVRATAERPEGPVRGLEASRIRLSVIDGGCGMSPEVLGRLFEPFFTTKPGGKGLGLWTVREIARQWGGTVEVDSSPGQGTAVHVLLPAIEDHHPLEPGAGNESAAAESILVVEPSDSMRRFACEILSSLGYRVWSASDGVRALEAVREAASGPVLLIADVDLPGLGGVDLAACVREIRPETRILLVSHRPATQQTEPRPAGESPILYKPFIPLELASRVFESLSPRPRSRQAQP